MIGSLQLCIKRIKQINKSLVRKFFKVYFTEFLGNNKITFVDAKRLFIRKIKVTIL